MVSGGLASKPARKGKQRGLRTKRKQKRHGRASNKHSCAASAPRKKSEAGIQLVNRSTSYNSGGGSLPRRLCRRRFTPSPPPEYQRHRPIRLRMRRRGCTGGPKMPDVVQDSYERRLTFGINNRPPHSRLAILWSADHLQRCGQQTKSCPGKDRANLRKTWG